MNRKDNTDESCTSEEPGPSLDLRKQKLRLIPKLKGKVHLPGLRLVDLSFNLISKLDTQRLGHFESPFSEMSSLEILELSHNRITFIHPNIFKGNPMLKVLNMSHNKLGQEGKLRCISKLGNLERLDISENEIYNLNYLKLSKFLKRSCQKLKYLYFKQIGQGYDDLLPSKKALMRFKLECGGLVDWDFKAREDPCEFDRDDIKAEETGPVDYKLDRRKSQPFFTSRNRDFDKSCKKKSKAGHSKKYINKRTRRKSQIFLKQQQKAPENMYSRTPVRSKSKWITKSPRGKSPFRDITNTEKHNEQREGARRTRTISRLISKVIRKTHRKTTRKQVTEFKEVKRNLKKFFKRGDMVQTQQKELMDNRGDSGSDIGFNLEDFDEIACFSPEKADQRKRSNTPGFSNRSSNFENQVEMMVRESTAFRMSQGRSEFDRKFKSIKSIIGPKILPEDISQNQMISPSINIQEGGCISFGVAKVYSKEAHDFKNML